ncbi:MAG: hypothetical protein HYR55_04945 [Acidobacteria bacterium]|nr:hypothetical protein [Acidobacteriota bacterium]
MTKILRIIAILTILALLLVLTVIAIRYAALQQIFSYFVDSASRLLAINQYMIKAAVALALLRFLYALRITFSFDKTRGSVPGHVSGTNSPGIDSPIPLSGRKERVLCDFSSFLCYFSQWD